MSLIRRMQQNSSDSSNSNSNNRDQSKNLATASGPELYRERGASTRSLVSRADTVQSLDLKQVERERRRELRDWMLDQLLVGLERTNLERTPDTRRMLAEQFQALYRRSRVTLTADQQRALFQEIEDEILGFGPLEPLIRDDSITEIMVNGPHLVFVERDGHLQETRVKFDDDAHVQRIIERIIRPLGRNIDRKWPLVDARLPDGSRVNAIIPPCAIDGSTITIRKFPKERLEMSDLLRFESTTPQMAAFLKACVVSKLNIVVSGGTGSGKTTLLNILSGYIPDGERIVTIEDSAELQLQQRHVVRLETKNPEVDGTGRVSIRNLVINSLRMRPDRIVVGECRGGEALDMLQAIIRAMAGRLPPPTPILLVIAWRDWKPSA